MNISKWIFLWEVSSHRCLICNLRKWGHTSWRESFVRHFPYLDMVNFCGNKTKMDMKQSVSIIIIIIIIDELTRRWSASNWAWWTSDVIFSMHNAMARLAKDEWESRHSFRDCWSCTRVIPPWRSGTCRKIEEERNGRKELCKLNG